MRKILRKLALSLSGHANKLCLERNAAVDSENVTGSGSYNLVHGLSTSNHSFWRGNRIDMHMLLQRNKFSESVPDDDAFPYGRFCSRNIENAFVAKRRVTDGQTKWINILDLTWKLC
jgi:hypothetical protein